MSLRFQFFRKSTQETTMSNAFIRVSSICHDLQNRYGSDDPLVKQLLNELRQSQRQEPLLPFGERRKHALPMHMWNARLGGRSVRS